MGFPAQLVLQAPRPRPDDDTVLGGGMIAFPDATPGIAVTNIGNNTDPVVFVGYEILLNGGAQHRIELAAANGNRLAEGWKVFGRLNVGPNVLQQLHPIITVNGRSNILDMVLYQLEAAPTAAEQPLTTEFLRFDASRLQLVISATLPTSSPRLRDFPSRGPTTSFANSLFIGDYTSLATLGKTAVLGWPELASSNNTDIGLGNIQHTCQQALMVEKPDSLWECNCACEGGARSA